MTPLHALDSTTLEAGFRSGELSPVEVIEAVLTHAERWEPHLHALYAPDADGARAAARASEARWRAGMPLSPLDGVPCTLKENIATRGVPVPLGTAATALVPAAADAPPAARLREAGAVLWAKTTMPDYGMLSSGLSSFHPLTRNPWGLGWNPGGSSAGAAAAAAAGFGPLHVGTDIGGSVRLPAGWCGIVGVKPSGGRVPIHPPFTGRVAGPMTRTVRDAARLLSVISQPDARDATALQWQPIDWLSVGTAVDDDAVRSGLRGLRIGWWRDAGWGLPVDPQVDAVVAAAVHAFAQAGCTIEPLRPFARREMIDGLDRFWRMRSWLDMAALPPPQRDRVLPYIRRWTDSAEHMTAAELYQGYSRMAALRDAASAACTPFDAVLSPVCPVATFAADWASPLNDPDRPFEHIAFTVPFNMSEQPAIALDAGRTADGRPVGLQISGRRHDDIGVLRLARAWELLRPLPPAWPQPPEVG